MDRGKIRIEYGLPLKSVRLGLTVRQMSLSFIDQKIAVSGYLSLWNINGASLRRT